MITYKNILETDEETQEKVRLWRNEPRVRAGMLGQSEISAHRHRQWLASLADNAGINQVRIAFSGLTPFGVINLRDIDRDAGSCDWGFYVGDDAFLGRKLGRRLIYDTQEWGFMEADVRKMYSTVRSDNLKVLHNDMLSGNHIEGFLKDHMRAASGPGEPGELIGIYLIAQFRDEWTRNREKVSSWAMIGEGSE